MLQMMWAGYNENMRVLVGTRILERMDTNLFNYLNLERPLYRSKAERKNRVKEDKSSWYRKNGCTATITVPTTPGSELARRVRETLQLHQGPVGTKIKVLGDQDGR